MDTIAEESSRWGMDATIMDVIYLKRALLQAGNAIRICGHK
jgi:hypothetical protein